MTFLKLHTHNKTAFIINMNNVDEFRSNGAGGTEFVYSDQSVTQAIESFEEVEAMIMYAIQFNYAVTSVQDVNLTPKEFVDAGDVQGSFWEVCAKSKEGDILTCLDYAYQNIVNNGDYTFMWEDDWRRVSLSGEHLGMRWKIK